MKTSRFTSFPIYRFIFAAMITAFAIWLFYASAHVVRPMRQTYNMGKAFSADPFRASDSVHILLYRSYRFFGLTGKIFWNAKEEQEANPYVQYTYYELLFANGETYLCHENAGGFRNSFLHIELINEDDTSDAVLLRKMLKQPLRQIRIKTGADIPGTEALPESSFKTAYSISFTPQESQLLMQELTKASVAGKP